ncbi:aspartic-type endopeptidase-like protein [Colletotrichum tofieldiae]|nr:aspartic-type endopeptidase-like protein [Colletotrichum tofieldiae]
MTLHEDTGLYLWGLGPQAELFVNSLAYLGSILPDQSATNLTIKVGPFQAPRPYTRVTISRTANQFLPLQVYQLNLWLLTARSGVFADGVSSRRLRQAPGPDVEQSVLKKFDNSTITTNTAETLASTWKTR